MKLLDLFSGIGGFSLGLERAGFQTVAFCEVDKECQAHLGSKWPGVPIYGDINELTGERLKADGVAFDAICGGFPCQDISVAGKGKGIVGERSGLWAQYKRVIKETSPKYVVIENVEALRRKGLALVLQDLHEIGYDAEWHCISSAATGGSHGRDRTWVVGYPQYDGWNGAAVAGGIAAPVLDYQERQDEAGQSAGAGSPPVLSDESFQKRERWVALIGEQQYGYEPPRVLEPRLGGDADVVSRRFHKERAARLKKLGNAVDPYIPYLIGKAIMAREAA